MNLLCFGYGQVAKNLVSNLLKKKVNLNLTISTRENSSTKKLGDFEFKNLEFKENAYDKKILDKLSLRIYFVFFNFIISPSSGGNHPNIIRY